MVNHHFVKLGGKRTTRGHRHTASTVLVFILLICVPISSAGQNRANEEQRMEALVAKHLGVFVTLPKQRDPAERVFLDKGTLTIGFLKTLSRDQSADICEAGRWLLTGRLSRTSGARSLFRADPTVKRIRLEFLRLKTTVNPSAKGRYEQNRAVVREMVLEIGRDKAAPLDPEVLKRTLQGPRCEKLVRNLLDTVRVGTGSP